MLNRIAITMLCVASLSGCASFISGGTGTAPVGTDSGARSLGQVFIDNSIERTAKIGYENQIKLAFVSSFGIADSTPFDSAALKGHEESFTIVDIRNDSEVKAKKIFANAIHIPLHELRERTHEIPINKPIVVHCAGGYRSAAGSSLLKSRLNGAVPIFDLSEDVKKF